MTIPLANLARFVAVVLGGLAFWLAGVAGAAATGDDGTSAPRASLSLDEIRERVAEARRRLRSLEVELLIRGRDPKTVQWQPQTFRRVVAASGPGRFVRSTHFSEGFPEDLDVDGNDVYYDGKTFEDFYPLRRFWITTRSRPERFAWKVQCELPLEYLGWWPPDDPSSIPDQGGRLALHEALADQACHVRPVQERIDGAW